GGFAPLKPDSSGMQAGELWDSIRAYSEKRLNETRQTLVAVGQFVDSLSGLPGRKALLYVTGGRSLRPGQALFVPFEAKYANSPAGTSGSVMRGKSTTEGFRYDASEDFNRLIDRANANRVTFYTLGSPEDVSGTNAQNAGDNAAWQDQTGTETFNMV